MIRTLIFFIGLSGYVYGQTTYNLQIAGGDQNEVDIKLMYRIFDRQVNTPGDLTEFMYFVYEHGYLMADYTLSDEDSVSVIVRLEPGEKFRWADIGQGNLPDDILYRSGIRNNIFKEHIVNFSILTAFFRNIIRYSENHGYPFAGIRLKGLSVTDRRISAELDYRSGPYITFGAVKLKHANNVHDKFLSAYLNIPPPEAYDQRKIDKIPYLINQLPYLSLIGPPGLHFANEKCEVLLDAADISASTFDGYIGLFPNPDPGRNFLVTGQVNLSLENLFRSGKSFGFDWQKPNTLMQELTARYRHPALIRLPLDAGIEFNLLKQDTTFLTRHLQFDLQYNKYRYGSVGINLDMVSSRLLSTEYIRSAGELESVDFNLINYGFTYIYNTLNKPDYPTRGIKITSHIKAGRKKILNNSGLDESFYDDIRMHTIQTQVELSMEKYIQVKASQVIYAALFSGYLHNDQLFLNDMFRLGGLNSIRGFNEKAIYATKYMIGKIEYRYSFESQSQMFVFLDGAGLDFQLSDIRYADTPFATGFGLDISTRAGILTLVYALGKSREQSFGLEYSRIHIGYSNRF